MGQLTSEGAAQECLEKIVDTTVDDLSDTYKMGDVIGEGRFSKVYSAVCAPLLIVCTNDMHARSAKASWTPRKRFV